MNSRPRSFLRPMTRSSTAMVWSGELGHDHAYQHQSGQSVRSLLPNATNVRRAFVDNSTTPVTFWVGNNHHGNIIKLEPLD